VGAATAAAVAAIGGTGEAGPERGRGREHSAEGMEASLTGDSVDGERR